MIKIDLLPATEYQLAQCQLFTDHVYESSEKMYKQRGSHNESKIKQDIFNGRAAECMVFNVLDRDGLMPSSPDFAIYKRKRKSFDADLVAGDKLFHVKSCLAGSPHPNSWLFQKTDPLITSGTEADNLFLCVIDEVGVSGYAYIGTINDVEFREPIVWQLRPSKTAIYEEDIKG